ncbi:MAG TPA: hypothetical protein V6C76_01015 [Drouetiella sp.]
MKLTNCRGLLGMLFVVGAFISFAPSAHAQAQNFDGTGGAYGDFDLQAQAAPYTPVGAQNSGANTGVYGNVTAPTAGNYYGNSSLSAPLGAVPGLGRPNLPMAGFMPLDKTFRGSLPPTRLDSFVANSGNPFMIYGDEGEDGPPPLYGFSYGNTIQSGIQGSLTTGHSGAPSMD